MKKILLGTAGVGVVIIVAAWWMGFPRSSDTEGTVGGAQRYQGAQMTSKDVKLGTTAVHDFIQSDVFNRIMLDPNARAVMARIASDSTFRQAMLNANMVELLNSADIEAALKAGGAALLAEPAFVNAMRVPAFAEATRSAKFLEVLAEPGFADVMMRKAGKGQQEYYRNLDAAAKVAFADEAARAAMRNPAFLDMVRRPGFADLLRRPALAEALRRPGLEEVLRKSNLAETLRAPAFADILRTPALAEAFRNPAFTAALRNPAYADAMRSAAFEASFVEASRAAYK